MTPILAVLVRRLCDPAQLEVFEGDLAELYEGGRTDWRYVRDVASLCLRHTRPALRSLAAATVLLLITGIPARSAFHYQVFASDAAGQFSLEIKQHQVIAATLDGVALRADQIVQAGDTLIIRGGDGGRDFRIAIKPQGGITWEPRLRPFSF